MARAFLIRELGPWVDEVVIQEWNQAIFSGASKGSTVPLTNIFGRLRTRGGHSGGRQPSLLLCAHWDTRPVADQDPDVKQRSLPVPGANDGASGVAVLLELARVLHARKLKQDILFGFFDGEDLGAYYYGSRMYARYCNHPAFAAWRPRQAILLDMVGKKDLCCTTELYSQSSAPRLWEEIHRSAARLGHGEHFGGPEMRINDDHVFLNAAGIPAILLIDYAYPFWHTTADTADKCCPESLQVVGNVLCEYLLSHPRVPSV
jgi:Zn-dependent M28 family amino/carboxypeptidase